MTKLHSLVTVYGTIDQAAVAAKSPVVIAKFAELLPGSTDLGNRGWYSQVSQIAYSEPNSTQFGTLEDALKDLSTVNVANLETGALPDADTLTKADLAKLYGSVKALAELKALSANGDESADKILDFKSKTLDKVKARIEKVVPKKDLESLKCECTSAIREVNGEYCTVLLTDSTDREITVESLKDVLDPLNWPKVNTFFQDIKARKPDPTGWGRMLEVVGTGTQGAFTLRTPLKYWKGELPDGGVFLNYDMDDAAFSDGESDHLVIVDNGYIVATPLVPHHPEKPGVRLQTSKELLIRGMSPTAAATLACNLGWADAGKSMFFDVARLKKRPEKMSPWVVSKQTGEPKKRELGAIPQANWSLPASNRNQIVEGAKEDAEDLVDHAATAAGEFVKFWQDGLTPEDINKVSTTFGTELTTIIQSVFTNAVSTVKPATRGGPK